MKKIIKMSLFIMVLSLCSIFCCSNVNAQEPGITLTKKTYIYTNSRKEARFYTSKGYAYCITPSKVGAQPGQAFSFKEKTSEKGLIYLLKSANSKNEHSYLVTQLAIWKYYNGGFTPEAYKGTSVNNEANALANKAKNAKKPVTNVSINFKVTNYEMFLNNDSTYYKSANMKATVTGATTYTAIVEGPSNIQLVRSNGTAVGKKASFKSGEAFYVQVPTKDITKVTKVKIKVTSSGTVSIAKRYTPNNNQLQELILIDQEKITVSKATTLSITPVKRSCEFVNNVYYDKDGNVTDAETYSIQCEKHTCEKVGETFFGIEGKVVDELTYKKECEKHICEKVGDTYFGKEGTEVDQLTYTKQCEKHVCEIIDNTYFGKTGAEVNYDTYKSECMHFCELYNNKYYGKDGTIVDEKTYTDQCTTPVVPVPDTDTDPMDIVIYILFGSLLLLSGLFVVTPSTKKM